MLPAPPHCATSRPPGRSDAGEVAEQRVVVGDPVERRGREDRVDRRRRPAAAARPRSATANATRSPNRASRSRAASTIDGDASSATTCPSGRRSASCSVTRPEPQPASSTVSSPRSGSRSRTFEPQRVIGWATRSYEAPSQSCGARALARLSQRPRAPSTAGARVPGRPSRPPRRPGRRSPIPFASAPAASSAAHTMTARCSASTEASVAACATSGGVPSAGGLSGWTWRPELRVVRVDVRHVRGQRRVERPGYDDEDDRRQERLPDPGDRVVDRRREPRVAHRDGRHERAGQRRDDQRQAEPEQQDHGHDVDQRRRRAAGRSWGRRARTATARCRPGPRPATAGRAP